MEICEQGQTKWILRVLYHQGQQGKQVMGFGVMSNLKVNKQPLSSAEVHRGSGRSQRDCAQGIYRALHYSGNT